MEKLLFSKLILITCIIFYSQSYSQDSYCVFKSEGTPIANNKTALKKGNILKQNDIVKLKVNESILMVDEKGALYKLENKQSTLKEYPYVEFSNYKIDQDVSSFSKKYLSYVWKRFSKGDDTGEHTGVVFRNNLLTLIQEPSDSVEIYRPEINFSWIPKNSKETQNYFLLKEKGKDHINKIQVFNLSGQKIMQLKGTLNFNVSNFDQGIYILKVYGHEDALLSTHKLILQK